MPIRALPISRRIACSLPAALSHRAANDDELETTAPHRALRLVRGGAPGPGRSEDLVGVDLVGLRVERLVAEGGMGFVYAARTVEGRQVALKVLQPRHAQDVGLVSRFNREIEHARRVDHPNVMPVLQSGSLPDGRPYFTMPLVDGVTLGALVRASGPLPVARALAITDQILAGLEALHAESVIHRDLSPENVLLTGDTNGVERAILLDLGFSHAPGVDTGDGVTPDSPGSLVGTLAFMSPEQATRARAITARSDLFVAALLAHYALTGRLPFRRVGPGDLLVGLVRDAASPVRRQRRDVPAGVDAALGRALAKHPDNRFESASAMRAALSPP